MDQLLNPSVGKLAFNLFLWFFALFLNRNCLLERRGRTPSILVMLLIMVVFSVFNFSGEDFFHYGSFFNYFVQGDDSHLEPVYLWLIQAVGFNYLAWRLIIWGLASVLYIAAIKRLGVDFSIASLFIVVYTLYYMGYSRNFLPITLLMFAATFMCVKFNDSSIKSLLITLLLLFLTIPLHKTMLLYCAVLLLASFNWGKKTIIILLLLFPLVISIPIDLYSAKLNSLFPDNSILERVASDYLSQENRLNEGANLFGWMGFFLEYLPPFLLLVFTGYSVFFLKEYTDHRFVVYWRFAFILIYMASVFYTHKDVSPAFFRRFWDAGSLGLVFFLGCFFSSNKRSGFSNICIWLMAINILFKLSYMTINFKG